MSGERTTTSIRRDDARQELDDLTVLTRAEGAGMDETRLTVARPAEVDESRLGALATIHQGSRSAPAAGDVAGLMTGGGVGVAMDVAVEPGLVAAVAPAEVLLGGAGTDRLAGRSGITARPEPEAGVRAGAEVPPPDSAAPEPPAATTVEAAGQSAAAPEPPPSPVAADDVGEAEPIDEEEALPVTEPGWTPEPGPEPGPDNAAPVILGATGTLGAEDQAVSGHILASDADGDALAYALADDGAPAHGTVAIAADGSYTYLPDPDWNGADRFTVAVSDGRGGLTTRTIEIEVAAVNDAPTVTAVTGGSGAEDAGITGRVVATDADGNALAFALAADGLPAHGTVTLHSDGTYAYRPASDWSGTDSFTVAVSDGAGGTVTRMVTVEVVPVADVPHLTAATGTMAVVDDHDALGAPTDDIIVAGPGGDVVYGGAGNDTILGGSGRTTVFAGSGDDVVTDAAGRYATVVGGSGADTIVTGQGAELVFGDGAAGAVTVPLDLAVGLADRDGSEVLTAVTVAGLPEGATLVDATGAAVGSLADGVWTLEPHQLDGLGILLPDGGPDRLDLTVGAAATETATGATAWTSTAVTADLGAVASLADGDDVIVTGAGTDTVYGGGGDDLIRGEGGADTLYGGEGADTIDGGRQADVIAGGAGDDLLSGDDHADTFLFEMGAGRDMVDGGGGAWADTIDLTGLAAGTTFQIDLDDGRSWTVTADEADYTLDLGDNVSGTVTVAGTDDAIRFDNIENVRW